MTIKFCNWNLDPIVAACDILNLTPTMNHYLVTEPKKNLSKFRFERKLYQIDNKKF